ncbi:MAG: dihydrodipicolinate synthase family protein [Spirochaetaceae bacterium]
MADLTRSSLVGRLFPSGIPRLWCPLLTHYDASGRIDHERIRGHLRHLAPTVRTFLAPGSTGDGWEMSDEERAELLELLLETAAELDLWILVGVLATERGAARRSVAALGAELAGRRVCGFTVTPPKGAELDQSTIHDELEGILELGYPTALYQLPQITENEMSPETVSDLAARYENFYLFKDTSGGDRVAVSGASTADVFMVRGAEGGYAKHLKPAGGFYDGFLLSTANCFAAELNDIVELVFAGRHAEAAALSARVEAVVNGVFDAVSALPYGNPFANANKAVDHVLAYLPDHGSMPAPMTHSGNRIPREAITRAERLLREQDLLPARGYLRA